MNGKPLPSLEPRGQGSNRVTRAQWVPEPWKRSLVGTPVVQGYQRHSQSKEGVREKYPDSPLFLLSNLLPFQPLYQTQLQANMQESQEYTVCRDKPPRSQNEAHKSRNWMGTRAKNNQQSLPFLFLRNDSCLLCKGRILSSPTEETQNLWQYIIMRWCWFNYIPIWNLNYNISHHQYSSSRKQGKGSEKEIID